MSPDSELYLDANRDLWNAWTRLHAESAFYDLPGFKAGKSSLRRIELAELGDAVAGKTLLHPQCHFGLDTLSRATTAGGACRLARARFRCCFRCKRARIDENQRPSSRETNPCRLLNK